MNDRKLFDFVIWLFAGLCLLVLLTSCNPYAAIYPPAANGETEETATPPAPTATAQAMTAPTPTPHHVYIVAADALEVRTGPSETAPNVGYLVRGQIVTVYETAQAEQEHCTTWAKIAHNQGRWVCMKYLKG